MAPTIKDVAQKSKVAYTTASDILNRGKSKSYADKTVARVQQAAAELGYKANHFAASLKTGKTNIIGVKGATDSYWGLFHPYLTKVFTGINNYFREQHPEYKFILEEFEDPDHKTADMDLVQRRVVDGIIFIALSRSLPAFIKNQVPVMRKTGLPFVVLHSTTEKMPCPNIGIEGEKAGYLGAGHLIGHGYTRIGYCGDRSGVNLLEKALGTGFARACTEKGIEPIMLPGVGYTTTDGKNYAEPNLAALAGLQALFIPSDAAAFGIIERLGEKGITVPDDLAIVSFGDDLNPAHINTGLTAICQPGIEKGYLGAKMLYEQFQLPPEKRENKTIILETELIKRKSCGCK